MKYIIALCVLCWIVQGSVSTYKHHHFNMINAKGYGLNLNGDVLKLSKTKGKFLLVSAGSGLYYVKAPNGEYLRGCKPGKCGFVTSPTKDADTKFALEHKGSNRYALRCIKHNTYLASTGDKVLDCQWSSKSADSFWKFSLVGGSSKGNKVYFKSLYSHKYLMSKNGKVNQGSKGTKTRWTLKKYNNKYYYIKDYQGRYLVGGKNYVSASLSYSSHGSNRLWRVAKKNGKWMIQNKAYGTYLRSWTNGNVDHATWWRAWEFWQVTH